MASNAIANYLKNLGQSMKYAATEVIKEQMPVTGEFVATNQEVFKDAYKTIQDIRIGMPRLSTIQNNVLYKSVTKGLSNIKSDVMSGKFYHPEREDPMASMGSLQTIMGALGGMGDEFNELMAILGGDFSGVDEGGGGEEQHPEYKTITKGDALVSASIIKSNMHSTNAIGRVITRLSENRTKTTKAIADMQMMQSARSMAVQQHGFDNMARGFNSIIDFNNQIMRVHVENSTKFYQTMTDITRDTNATLHAIHDIQETLKNAQAPDVKEFKDQVNWKEMFKGGLNLKAYTTMVKDNIKKSPMYGTYAMIMGLPMMLEQFVANPMHTIAKSGISALMGAQLQVAMQRIDKTLAGAFSTAAAKLFDYGKENSKSFLGKVAQIFGFKQKDHKLATADASKYQRGNMSWNGIAQKSLVEVIPGHLRRIEAALTGQGERLMNFETGKWTSAVAVKKYERNIDNQLTRDALSPLSKQMKAIAGSNNYASPQQRRQMSKAIDDMMKGIYAKGYVDFNDINLNKDGKYGNEGLVQLLAGILRSMPTHEVAGVTSRIAEAKQAKGEMISASGRLENYGPANEIINGGLNGQIRKRSNLYQNTADGNFGLPNLTELTDSRGYTLYDYQNMILEELRLHRSGNNRKGGKGSRKSPNGGNNPPSGGSDGDEPPPAPPTRDQFRSDPADKARRHDSAIEKYQDRLRRQGLGTMEGSTTIDLDAITKDPNSKEAKDMIAQMLYLASENRRNKDDADLNANSSFLDGMIRGGNKDDNSNIIDQLLKAGSIGEKFDVVQKNIGALIKSPATLLAGVISKADAAVYDILFGKDVGEKDENGKPILGIFHKMTNEVDKAMEGLNETINDMGKKIKDFFTGKNGIGSWIKKGLGLLGVDVDEISSTIKGTAKKYGRKILKGAKGVAKDIGGDVHNAVMGTMADMGMVNQEGKMSFDTVFENLKSFTDPGEQVQTNARGTKRVQSAGLTFISPGEAIIPANMNPWNPNRDNVDVKTQQKNEERLRTQFSSKFKNAFAQLGEAIPTNAGGTANTAAQYLVQQLNISGLTADEVNSVILAKNKAERNAAIDKIIESHKGNFEIKQQLSNLETFLTSNKFARGATTLRASNGVKQGEDGKLALGDITSAGMHRATHVDTIADYNYTALGKIRGFANQHGYKMDSDEEIGQKKFAVREGPTTGIRQGMLQAFGTDPVKAAELSKNFILKNSFSLAKGGAIGALLSAVFPLGGPLMGSLIGAGIQTLSKSEKFQNYMFGKVVKDDKGNESRQGGLISKSVMDTFAKYAPDMKKYGITGAIGGLITPFGPLGGAMIGAGASIIKNNKRVNDFFFGDSVGLLNKDRKAAIKKAFPNMGAAMLGTFFLGPFGLLGNAVLGAGIGLVSTTETFKKIMLGPKGRDGVRRGGIAGAIRRQITDPFKRSMNKMGEDITKWFRDDIVKPVGRGIVPIGKLMGGMIQRGTNNLFNFISRAFGKKGTGIARLFDKALYGVRKAGGLGKWIGKNTVGRIGSGIAGAIGKAGDAAERYAIMHGYGNMYSAKERLDFYDRNNITGTAQVNSDVAMNKMSDDELTQNSQMLSMINAHLDGDVERDIDKQRREEAGLFENDMEKISGDLTDQTEADALNKLKDKLHTGLMKGKYDAVNADEAAKLIAGARINEDTKRKVLAAFNKGHANMMDAEGRFKLAKDKSYLNDSLKAVRENFNLGDISDKETIELVKSLSRNAENEVSVRRYGDKPSNAISEEAAKAGEEGEIPASQKESMDLAKKQTDIQEKTKTLTEMMLEKLTSINDTLMGKNVDKTSNSHGALIDAVEYMRRQNALTSDRFGEAYGEAQNADEKRRAKSDAELGLVKGGALEGQSADARNTLVDAFDRTYRNNKLSDLAGYFKQLEEAKKKLGHDGKIADGGLEEIIKLTQEKGVKKTRRILILTMYGYKIPVEHYKAIVNLTDTGFLAMKNVAKAGGNLDKIDSFVDIMDDPAGRAAARQYAMIAEIQKVGDGSDKYNKIGNLLAGQLTSDDYVKLMEDEDLRDKRLMGASYQDLYDEDQSKFAGSADGFNVPQGLSSSMNGDVTPFDAEKQIKNGAVGALGRFGNHTINNAAKIGSGVVGAWNTVMPGTTYLRQTAAKAGDKLFAGYVPQAGTQLTTIAAGITGAMPRNAAEQYMNNFYGFQNSEAGKFYHGVEKDNRKFTYDKFNKLSEEKQKEYVQSHSQEELDALIATAPEDARTYLINKISDYKAEEVPTNAFGTKLAAIGGSLASIAGNFAKDTGKSFLGGMFGLDKDGKEDKEKKEEPEEVAQQQVPQAQMGPQIDSNAIAAIGKSVAGDSSNGGGVTKNADGTMIVPAGDGQFLEYGKSKVDGSYMVAQTKNNVEVENRRKHKDQLQERSVAALEGMAGTLGVKLAGAGGQMAKKAGGGLLDMLKGLAEAPFKILDSIPFIGQLGLGAMMLGGIKKAGKFAVGKLGSLAGGLINKIPGVAGLREALGGKIAQGGLSGGILNKLFGRFALTPGTVTGAAGAVEQGALNFGEEAAGRSGGGFLSKAGSLLGKLGTKGKVAAGILGGAGALFGGYKLFGGNDNEKIQYGPHESQVTTRGQLREKGLTDEEINILQTYAMHGAPTQLAMEAIYTRRQQAENQRAGNDKLQQSNYSGGGIGSTLAGLAGNIGGYKLGARFSKNRKWLGGGIGSALGGAAVQYATTGEMPGLTDIAMDAGTGALLNWGADKIGSKIFSKGGAQAAGQAAEQMALNFGDDAAEAAAKNPGMFARMKEAITGKYGPEAMQKAKAFFSKFGVSKAVEQTALNFGEDAASAATKSPGFIQSIKTALSGKLGPEALVKARAMLPKLGTVGKVLAGVSAAAAFLAPKVGKASANVAKNYGKSAVNDEVLVYGGAKDQPADKIGMIPKVLAGTAGTVLATKLAGKLGGGAKTKLLSAIAGGVLGKSALEGKMPELSDFALAGGLTYAWKRAGAVADAAKGSAASKGLKAGITDGLRALIPKTKLGKLAALAGAGYLGSNYLLGDNSASAAGLPGYTQEDIDNMSPEELQAIYDAHQDQDLVPNEKGQSSGLMNLIGSLGGMAAGGAIGKRLFKKHPLIGTILGATAGNSLGDMLTGGESPTLGGIASDLATNSVLYNAGNIIKYGKNKLFGKAEASAAPVQQGLDFGEDAAKTAGKASGTTKGIVDRFKEFISSNTPKVSNTIESAKTAISEAPGKAVDASKDVLEKAKPYLEKISAGFKKVFEGIKNFVPDKAVPAIAKFFEGALEQISKPANLTKAMAKMAKQGTALAAGASTLGIGYIVATIGFAAADFYRGYNNADEMLKLKEGTATDGMKIATGLVTAVTGAIPFLGIFLPEDYMLELAIEYLGPAFGFGKEDLEKAKNGEEDPHDTPSFAEKISDGLKSVGGSILDTAKKAFDYTPIGVASNFISRAKAMATGETMVSDSGNKVSDEEVEQNKSIILGKLKSGSEEVFTAIQEWIPTEAFDSKDGLIAQMVKQSDNPTAIKNAMSKVANKISKISDLVGMGTSTALINMPTDIEQAKKSFINGSNDAGSILNIEPSSITNGMKTLAGIVAALCDGIPFLTSLIKEDDIVKLAIDNMGPALGIDRAKVDDLRRKGYSKTQRAKDAAAKVTSIFRDKAKDLADGIRGGIRSAITGVKQFASKVYDKGAELYHAGKEAVSNAIDAAKQKAAEAKKAAEDKAEEIKQDVEDKAEDAKETASSWADKASEAASAAYNKGKEIAGNVADAVGGAVDSAKQGLSNAWNSLTKKNDDSSDSDSGEGKHAKFGRGGNFYSQLDPAFAMAYNAGSDSIHQTMSDSGCGPVSAVNALSSMGVDVDPRVAAQYALDNGYKEQNGGTIPTFFKDFMGKAGVDAQNVSGNQITDSLKAGNPVVLMGKDGRGTNPNNPFAENPHYVTATGMDNNGNIVVQDPESYTPNQVYKASDVIGRSSVAIAANRYGSGKMGRVPQYGKGRSRYGRGTDNAEFIWNWLINQGFSNQAAAGIMGNMQQECSFNPHAYQSGPDQEEAPPPQGEGSAGYGLCQWTGSRTQKLIEYAASKGKSSGDLETQLEYMMIEARESGIIDKMNAAQTPEEAATIWGKEFERCGEMGDRIKYATEAFQKQGKGLTTLGTASGGPGKAGAAPKKNGGLMGKLGEVAEILSKALTPWAASDSGSSGPGSTSSNANIRKASDWARSVEGHPGHGNNGCTAFVQDYLNQAGHPFAKTMSLYVPTLMEQAKEQNMWKESNPSEGDIAVLETNHNRDDGPDHVVIYDGKGGCWGNSSGQNKFLHYDNMLDSFPEGAWGYVNTGDGSSSGDPQSSGNPRDEKEVLRDSSLDYGAGKHARFGMGKRFGRAKGVPNNVYSPRLGLRDNKSKYGRGGMMDSILGAAQKVAAPVSKMMSSFGDKFKSILSKSSLMPAITKIFGDDNPFLSALGMSSPSSGSSGTSTMQSGPGSTGSIALPQEGSVGQRMMAGLPDASTPNNGHYGDPRPNHIYGHGGIDYNSSNDAAPIPTPVDGTVEDVGFESGGYGNYVQVLDAAGIHHIFGHLSTQSVSKGDKVTAGQIIGNMGSTGASTGPHLHYQVDPPENGGAETNKPHIDPNGYMPPAGGAGKHSRFGMGYKPRVSKWGLGGWQSDLANTNSLKSTPKPVGESFKFDPSFGVSKFEQKYARYGMGGEYTNIEGLDIPEYNKIKDDDPIFVKEAKYKKQLELQKQQQKKASNAITAQANSTEPGSTFTTPGIVTASSSSFINDPLTTTLASSSNSLKDYAQQDKAEKTTTPTTLPGLDAFIPIFDQINDDKSSTNEDATKNVFSKYFGLPQSFEDLLKSTRQYSTEDTGSKMYDNIEGLDIPEYDRITDDDSLSVRQAKYQKQLQLQREQSLKDASKGADKAAELQDSLTKDNDTTTKEPVADESADKGDVPLQTATTTAELPSDSKIAELIEGQNKTNQLLAAILAVANTFISNMQTGSSNNNSSDNMQLNNNTRTKENALTTNIKAVLSSLGGGSNVGIGDKLIPSKNDPTNGIGQIMSVLNSVAGR